MWIMADAQQIVAAIGIKSEFGWPLKDGRSGGRQGRHRMNTGLGPGISMVEFGAK